MLPSAAFTPSLKTSTSTLRLWVRLVRWRRRCSLLWWRLMLPVTWEMGWMMCGLGATAALLRRTSDAAKDSRLRGSSARWKSYGRSFSFLSFFLTFLPSYLLSFFLSFLPGGLLQVEITCTDSTHPLIHLRWLDPLLLVATSCGSWWHWMKAFESVMQQFSLQTTIDDGELPSLMTEGHMVERYIWRREIERTHNSLSFIG